ncbi:hypothetical protein HMPREF0183_0274 [Brevibacterium mcbrellneri ATCC 49030]|uniref:Uncharacterized protein n=1 Tax=Brevibacterium mcbrellneri ATCC 49030 TaxID=585530 RepID=D4YK14_9MICO|nr:hypothetical protein HMPREF0183_0274 [Brevibacterium mcbrellneri ATCC 49030]
MAAPGSRCGAAARLKHWQEQSSAVEVWEERRCRLFGTGSIRPTASVGKPVRRGW